MLFGRISLPLHPTSITLFLVLSSFVRRSYSFAQPTRRDFVTSTTATTVMAANGDNNLTGGDENIAPAVHWGIVGLGDVTQRKSGPPFWKCEGSELVAVMRRTPGKAQEFAQRVPNDNCKGYENLDAMLQHPGLQAVYVSTRPGTHLEIGKRVAEAGKACYIEKPVGRCAAETQQLQEIFVERGLPLYTAYISRAYERTQALKRLLHQERVLGDRITDISYTLIGTGGARDMEGGSLPWRLDASQSGGGLIMDVGCHVLDRIDYLCGPLVNVQGQAENRNSPKIPVEDYVHLTAEIGEITPSLDKYALGAKVECVWDFASNEESKDELVLTGPKGSIILAGMSPDGPINVLDSNGAKVEEITFQAPEHTAQRMIQGVADELRGAGSRDFLSRGDNAVRTSNVIDTVLSSYYGAREIGYWNRSDSWPGRLAASLSEKQNNA